MNQQIFNSRFFQVGALFAMVTLGSAGCGEGMPDPTDSAQSALTSNTAGPYGSVTGTREANTGSHQTTVTKIIGWGSTDNVYGIKLFWDATSKMFGVTNGSSAQNFNVDGDPVYKVEYTASQGNLRGIKFTNSTATLCLGNCTGPMTAFNNLDAEFTDIETWKGDVNMVQVIWGAKFHYVTP